VECAPGQYAPEDAKSTRDCVCKPGYGGTFGIARGGGSGVEGGEGECAPGQYAHEDAKSSRDCVCKPGMEVRLAQTIRDCRGGGLVWVWDGVGWGGGGVCT
jgi:hypothetical protein